MEMSFLLQLQHATKLPKVNKVYSAVAYLAWQYGFARDRKRIYQKTNWNTDCSQRESDTSKLSVYSIGTTSFVCLLNKQTAMTCPILIGYKEYSVSFDVCILFLLVQNNLVAC